MVRTIHTKQKIWKSASLFIAVAVLAMGLAAPARGASDRPPTAALVVDTQSFFVGKSFTMTVLVKGSDIVEPPDLSGLDNSSLALNLIDETALNENGEKGYAIRYKAIPMKPGAATIPPLKLLVNGGLVISTAPKTLDVRMPEMSSKVRLSVELAKRRCYVGEPVVLNVIWRSALPLNGFRAVRLDVPALRSDKFGIRSDYTGDPLRRRGATSLPVSNMRIIAAVSKAVVNGVQYNVVRFKKIIAPKIPGKIVLDPATLLCSYIPLKNFRRRNIPKYPAFFNNNFFKQPETGKYNIFFAKSERPALQVDPLPADGKPAHFDGLVGEFSISTKVDRTAVNVGDPITVTMTIHSPNPLFLGGAYPPELADIQVVKNNFNITEPWFHADTKEPDSIAFTATIIPKHDAIKAVPAFDLPYFNPDTKSYGVASAPPIPITVEPAEMVTVSDVETSDGKTLKNIVIPNREGIRGNDVSPTALSRHREIPWEWIFAIVLAQPALFLLFLAATAKMRLARRDPAAARSKYALANFRGAMAEARRERDSEAALSAIEKAVRQYFADKFDTLPFAHTKDEVVSVLENAGGIDERHIETVVLVYNLAYSRRFAESPIEPDIKTLKRTLPKAVSAIDAELGWKKVLRKRPAISALPLFAILAATVLFTNDTASATSADSAVFQPASRTDAEIFAHANQLFDKANKMALENPGQAGELYSQSALEFQFLTRSRGIRAPSLLMDLGNAYMMTSDTGRAILAYRRALKLDPSNSAVKDNLEYARSLVMDKLPKRSLIDSIVATVFFWHYLPYDVRLACFAAIYAAFWLTLAVMAFRQSRKLRWTRNAALLLSLAFTASLIVSETGLDAKTNAVIVAEKALARKGPSNIYAVAFTTPLHSGTECRVLEKKDDWARVKLANGDECWLPLNSVEEI